MIKLVFYSEDEKIIAYHRAERIIKASCVVRNELNGWRPNKDKDPKSEVVEGITNNPYYGPPVMPRPFPKGLWNVYKPRERTDEYLAPWYIPTDAEQVLETWSLDKDGRYNAPDGGTVVDIGYGLHYSTSNTTVGCIKIHEYDDIIWLATIINEELVMKGSAILEVL